VLLLLRSFAEFVSRSFSSSTPAKSEHAISDALDVLWPLRDDHFEAVMVVQMYVRG
jgi:hypothetical protein